MSPFFSVQAAAEDVRSEESTIRGNIYTYPLTYREKPLGFGERPPGWREKPLGFREKPLQWTDRPLGFLEKIATTIEPTRGFTPTPPNYIEKESHPQINTREDYAMTPLSHPLVDEDESKRISTTDHPGATTVSSIAEKREDPAL